MIVDMKKPEFLSLDETDATRIISDNLQEESFERGIAKKEIRSYEVSLWTLQDSFITVLKWSDALQKNRIREPKMSLNTDGTQNFNFSIPMYIEVQEDKTVNPRIGARMVRKENPIWYNTQNGNLIKGMRKIKVIFNKHTEDQKIFEFVITKVTETHETDNLICEVECEGLAFNELGKQGYLIELSSDVFYDEYTNWFNKMPQEVDMSEGENYNESLASWREDEPHATLQYWNEEKLNLPLRKDDGVQIINPRKWYYKIQMNWDSYHSAVARTSDKVYEDDFVSSWDENGNPLNIERVREKERLLDESESNLYNLTQKLAETFGVFCRYEYGYDENNHIISRTVVYYNNFFEENHKLSLTYPYTSSSISREIDSMDIVTKMYVQSVDDGDDVISIMESEANRSGEDYILNFDYLKSVDAITDEQYEEIDTYERDMRKFNLDLIETSNMLTELENKRVDVAASLTVAKTAYDLSVENYDKQDNLLSALSLKDGTDDNRIERTNANPYQATLIKDDDGTYHINIKDSGVYYNTLQAYELYDLTNYTVKDYSLIGLNLSEYSSQNYSEEEISRFSPNVSFANAQPQYDEFNNLVRINNISKNISESSNIIYLTYQYDTLYTYSKKIKDIWKKRRDQNAQNVSKYTTDLADLDEQIEELTNDYKELQLDKEARREKFNLLMGSALREGYWTPNEYKDCNNKCSEVLQFNNSYIEGTTNTYASVVFDTVPFDDELKLTYEIGINQEPHKHTCFYVNNFDSIAENYKDCNRWGIIFHNFTNGEYTVTNGRILMMGSSCELVFIREANEYKPVIMILDDTTYSNTEISLLKENAQLYYIDNSTNTIIRIAENNENQLQVIDNPSNIIYPRIKIDNFSLKTDTTNLMLSYDNHILEYYKDFYVLSRNTAYYITLQPRSLLCIAGLLNWQSKNLEIFYTISQANTAIYLDAKKIMEENAYPKVSYNAQMNILDKSFIRTLYNKLNYLVMINDHNLKLENVHGYISSIDLDLDNPQEDSVEIQNYKNKFEDLFSSIVAATESMQSNSYMDALARDILTVNGTLKFSSIENAINSDSFKLSLNSNQVILDKKEGIIVENDSGVVALRGGGIFVATEKDDNQEWKWTPAVTPTGFNSELIKNGQLDISNLALYAGTKVKFQFNENGLFAYKDLKNDQNLVQAIMDEGDRSYLPFLTDYNGIDRKSYVVFNEDGLFLRCEDGDLIYDTSETNNIRVLPQTTKGYVNRVYVNWQGFFIDDWSGQHLIEAGVDGNLRVKGRIEASSGNIGNWIIDDDGLFFSETKTINNEEKIYYAAIAPNDDNYIIWAGNEDPEDAVFSVSKEGLLTTTSGKIGAWTIDTDGLNYQYTTETIDNEEVTYYTTLAPSGNYIFWAGTQAAENAPFSIEQNGAFHATAGEIGGWNITVDGLNYYHTEEGRNEETNEPETYVYYTALNPSDDYVFWAGAVNPAEAPFYIKSDGTIYSRKTNIAGGTFQADADADEINFVGNFTGKVVADDIWINSNIDAIGTNSPPATILKYNATEGFSLNTDFFNITTSNPNALNTSITSFLLGDANGQHLSYIKTYDAGISSIVGTIDLTIGNTDGDNYIQYTNNQLTIKGNIISSGSNSQMWGSVGGTVEATELRVGPAIKRFGTINPRMSYTSSDGNDELKIGNTSSNHFLSYKKNSSNNFELNISGNITARSFTLNDSNFILPTNKLYGNTTATNGKILTSMLSGTIATSMLNGTIATSMLTGNISTNMLSGTIDTSMLNGTIVTSMLSGTVTTDMLNSFNIELEDAYRDNTIIAPGTDEALEFWEEIDSTDIPEGIIPTEWTINTEYVEDNIVEYDNIYYQCIKNVFHVDPDEALSPLHLFKCHIVEDENEFNRLRVSMKGDIEALSGSKVGPFTFTDNGITFDAYNETDQTVHNYLIDIDTLITNLAQDITPEPEPEPEGEGE